MRIAIVHDYLAQPGGAERVVEAMHQIWPKAPIFTSVYDPEGTFASFKDMDIRTSFLQNFARKEKVHKLALPLFPLAFEQFDLRDYDVILSSASTFAKGVITGPEQCHICYCHNPSRFLWRYHEYVAQGGQGRMTRRALAVISHFQRQWDYAAAQRVDHFLCNSHNVSRRIQKFYQRQSIVLNPPADLSRFSVAPQSKADYFLIVSRFIGYKRVDLAIEACNRLNVPLKVVGSGPEEKRLRALAGPTIEMCGRLPDKAVSELLQNCRAFLFPGEEDFGIAPVEAMACGRPVIAYRAGGALETVVEGKTGLFFDAQTPESLATAICQLDKLTIDPLSIRDHAEQFALSTFQARLKEFVEKRWYEHNTHPKTYRMSVSPEALAPTNGVGKENH